MKNERVSSFDLVGGRPSNYRPRPIVHSSNRISKVSIKNTNKEPKPVPSSILIEPQPRVVLPKNVSSTQEKFVSPVKKDFIPPQKKVNKNNKLLSGLLVGMAVLVFIAGMVVSFNTFRLNKKVSEKVSAQSSIQANSEINENSPSDEDKRNYIVAPDKPRMIYIPKINVDSRVKEVGINKKGQLDVPGNIHDVAWYRDSALPGSSGGATLIDGHVSGPTQKGVFYNIKTLNQGDLITVEKGNGQKINYEVRKVEIVDTANVDMSKMLVSRTPGLQWLNLISCTGKYNEQKKDFEQRALIFAEIN